MSLGPKLHGSVQAAQFSTTRTHLSLTPTRADSLTPLASHAPRGYKSEDSHRHVGSTGQPNSSRSLLTLSLCCGDHRTATPCGRVSLHFHWYAGSSRHTPYVQPHVLPPLEKLGPKLNPPRDSFGRHSSHHRFRQPYIIAGQSRRPQLHLITLHATPAPPQACHHHQ